MIKLAVEDYCQNCPDFKPVSESVSYLSYGDVNEIVNRDTTVCCKHSRRCAIIAKQIKEREKMGCEVNVN